jgi:uncharacterized membrane protein
MMIQAFQTPAGGAEDNGTRGLRIELAPNCSLSDEGALLFVAVVATTTFAVAGFFAIQGFWPVLPFAGLEVGLLAWAVKVTMRRARCREHITIDERSITIEATGPDAPAPSVFPRHWAKVKLHGPHAALHPSRLVIESHGRAREVGRFLTEDQRRELAARLKQLVGNVDLSSSLG